MGDRRVRDAPARDQRAGAARGYTRAPRGQDARDPALDRSFAARRLDLDALGERTIYLDCDVLQADGGTRSAAITGAYVALVDAVGVLRERAMVKKDPIHGQAAAVSVGIYKGMAVLDLDYAEDSEAETDMNVVMNEQGAFIELQGTAEGHAFRMEELNEMLQLARDGIMHLVECQRTALASGA